MFYRTLVVLLFISVLTETLAEYYINPLHNRPKDVRYYPRKSLFRKADLIDNGCRVFIDECPSAYKQNVICARHYDGHYKSFNNYCEMEFDNCESWRQWSMIKHQRC